MRRAVTGRALIGAFDRPLTYALVTAVVAALLWEAYARQADALLIPTVGEIAAAFAGVVTDPEVWAALARSHQAVVLGLALAIVVGVPTGLLMGRYAAAEAAGNPYLVILLASPMAALVPLLLMAFGLGIVSRLLLVFVFAVVVVVVNTRTGVRQVDPLHIEMSRSFLATERQLWRHVLFPGAMPGIMVGFRLGLGRALQAMVVGELLLVAAGIGGLVLEYTARYQAGELYVLIGILLAEAVLLNILLNRFERRVLAWSRHSGRGDPNTRRARERAR